MPRAAGGDLPVSQRPRFIQFMAATKGVDDYSVAQALSDLTPGLDWRNCSRGHMARRWAAAPETPEKFKHMECGLERVTLTQLCEKIEIVLSRKRYRRRRST